MLVTMVDFTNREKTIVLQFQDMSKIFENSPRGQGLVVPRTKKAMGMRCTGPPAKFELEKICTKACLLQRVALGMTWDNLDDLSHSWFSMRKAYEYF